MNVTRRTATELELHESATVVWLILGAFGLGGSYVFVHEGRPLYAALLLIGAALAGMTFATRTTCRFDKTSGELTCTSRSTFRATHARHPLADIVGARTERSSAQRSRTTRIVLSLSSGATVPLTTQYGSNTRADEQSAKAIREFLELPEPVNVPIPGFGDLFRMAFSKDAAGKLGEMYGGAIAHHEDAVRRQPDNVDARRQLATALALGNRPDEAKVHLVHARDVASRGGNDDIASQLDEAIHRLDTATDPRG